MYDDGEGVTQDPAGMARLYEQACEGGFRPACESGFGMGVMISLFLIGFLLFGAKRRRP